MDDNIIRIIRISDFVTKIEYPPLSNDASTWNIILDKEQEDD